MTTDQRQRIYKRIKQREYRSGGKKGKPRETVATARRSGGDGGANISLAVAGLEPGVRYLASPRPGGAILLQPLRDDDR